MKYQKKTSILIAILSALFIINNCQSAKAEKEPDEALLRVLYAFKQNNHTRESLSSRTDTMALDIGYRLSQFSDLTAPTKDSLRKLIFEHGRVKSLTVIRNQEIAESVVSLNQSKGGNGNVILPNSYVSFTIYKDRDKRHIYTLDKELNLEETTIFFDEKIEPQLWTIENDTCRILNYLCNKATTKFRGREYEVYFTTEIPINEGPWKLYGLPGLILTARTTDGALSFQAIGIEKAKDKSITIPDSKDYEVCKNLKQYHQFVQSKSMKEQYIFDKRGDITIAEKFSSKKVLLLETEEN